MNYLKCSSVKIGLIASALLVFSACGSDEGPENRISIPSTPLFDQQAIEAGNVCEFGGTMVRGGLDKDKDGELSASEVNSETPVCNAEDEGGQTPAGPPLLVKTETLAVGDETCPDGGKRVHVGFDIDENGELSAEELADEKTKTTELCNSGPIDACVGAEQLQIVSIELEDDAFGFYEVDRPYEVRVELNHEIDTGSLVLKDILHTLGDDELAYTVDPNNNKIAIVEFTGDVNNTSYAMAIAANDGCTTGSAGLRTPIFHLQQSRINVTYDEPGFTAEGDTIELCYETRNADECSTNVRGVFTMGEPTSGCIELTADATDIANESVFVQITCKDSQNPASFSAQHQKRIPTVPTLISFDSAEFPGLANIGEVDLHWETYRMESCTLSDGTDSEDVPVNESSLLKDVEETTAFVLTCEDADGQEYSATRRVTVGPGILRFEASISQRAPGFPLQFSTNWETSLLYGTCDVNFEYASTVVDLSNINQQADYNIHPRYRRGAINGNQPSPTEDLNAQIQGTATLTCRDSSANGEVRTLEIPLRQY